MHILFLGVFPFRQKVSLIKKNLDIMNMGVLFTYCVDIFFAEFEQPPKSRISY